VKLVVDTNIVFSTLLNPKSFIGELLMSAENHFEFFAPELLTNEIERYANKIEKLTKLDANKLEIVKQLVLNRITFVSEDLISEKCWTAAYKLTKNTDEDDTPFVALSIEIGVKLWTGDKKLAKGINAENKDIIITTQELKDKLSQREKD